MIVIVSETLNIPNGAPFVIMGLGNPGEKYENTRHNTGFEAVDEFARKNSFPVFKLSKKYSSEISENTLNDEKIILAKPQTFMNNSGKAAESLTKLKPVNLIIIHDDIDLSLGTIKIVENRGSGGHKGVESIIKELGSNNFIRIRIGIKNETDEKPETEDFVLQKFNKEEEEIIKEVIKKTTEAVEVFLKEGLEKAMNQFN